MQHFQKRNGSIKGSQKRVLKYQNQQITHKNFTLFSKLSSFWKSLSFNLVSFHETPKQCQIKGTYIANSLSSQYPKTLGSCVLKQGVFTVLFHRTELRLPLFGNGSPQATQHSTSKQTHEHIDVTPHTCAIFMMSTLITYLMPQQCRSSLQVRWTRTSKVKSWKRSLNKEKITIQQRYIGL